MSKILIIGNGFDRQLGLKTDFLSFLDWMTTEGYGLHEEFLITSKRMCLKVKNDGIYQISRRNGTETNKEYYSRLRQLSLSIDYGFVDFPKSNFLLEMSQYLELYFHLPDLIPMGKNEFRTNIWYCFFQTIRFHKNLGNSQIELTSMLAQYAQLFSLQGNWIDLEGIIWLVVTRIIEERSTLNTSFNFIHFYFALVLPFSNISPKYGWKIVPPNLFVDQNYEKIKELMVEDFMDFKFQLIKYLKLEQKKVQGDLSLFDNLLKHSTSEWLRFSSYDQIISFNYTNYFWQSERIYHVHGDINDNAKIVFGLDPFTEDHTFQDSGNLTQLEQIVFKDPQLSKLTKISQLLSLQKDKRNNRLIQPVEQLVIVGHSIGVQDYSYFFSCIDGNQERITIDCLWYEFNFNNEKKEKQIEKDEVDKPVKNNELSTQNALFKMIQQYERYAKKRILHRMIFEGRIKFVKIEIPIIHSIMETQSILGDN